MTHTAATFCRLEDYLGELRACLRRLPAAEVSEIVDELRSHVLDSAASNDDALTEDSVRAAIDRLGRAEDLASLYVTESLLSRAGRSGSPWPMLCGILRWATVSGAGLFAALGLAVGLVISASFFVAALHKPFAPSRAGLWRLDDGSLSLRLGFGAPAPGLELLGWWIVPLGLLLGACGLWLTLQFGRWCIRRYRRTPLEAL